MSISTRSGAWRQPRARIASSATPTRFGPLDRRADDLVGLALGIGVTSSRSASSSGQNSERSSCRPSSRRCADVQAEVELGRRAEDHAAASERLGERDELPRLELLGARVGGEPERLERLARRLARARPRVLERARQRLAPVRERVAHQRARPPARGAGPVRRSPISAESTRGRGVNTARSTLRSIRTSQASCASTLGEP